MSSGDRLGDRQSQSQTLWLLRLRLLRTPETLEDKRQVLGGNANASVLHPDDGTAPRLLQRNGNAAP